MQQSEHTVTANAIQVRNINLVFSSPSGPFCVLDNISLTIRPGELLAVVGPSGCGKTSLLRVLGGLQQPTGGSVWLDGESLTHPRRDIGFVFQRANLMPWRTVLRNVTLPLEVEGLGRQEAEARALDLLELVGLSGFEQAYPSDLSGGMQQRVTIARALIHDPLALLLDEPFGSLDALTRERMNLDLLRIWHRRRTTVVLVTHNIAEAVFLADRVLVMNSRPGRIVDEVVVPLPRPRELSAQWDAAFGQLVERIRRSIGCPDSQCDTM